MSYMITIHFEQRSLSKVVQLQYDESAKNLIEIFCREFLIDDEQKSNVQIRSQFLNSILIPSLNLYEQLGRIETDYFFSKLNQKRFYKIEHIYEKEKLLIEIDLSTTLLELKNFLQEFFSIQKPFILKWLEENLSQLDDGMTFQDLSIPQNSLIKIETIDQNNNQNFMNIEFGEEQTKPIQFFIHDGTNQISVTYNCQLNVPIENFKYQILESLQLDKQLFDIEFYIGYQPIQGCNLSQSLQELNLVQDNLIVNSFLKQIEKNSTIFFS